MSGLSNTPKGWSRRKGAGALLVQTSLRCRPPEEHRPQRSVLVPLPPQESIPQDHRHDHDYFRPPGTSRTIVILINLPPHKIPYHLSLEYEPSPTLTALNVPGGRHRPILTLAVPPPLPTLPSESLLRIKATIGSHLPPPSVDLSLTIRQSHYRCNYAYVSLSALQQQHIRDEAGRMVTSSSSAAEDDMNASPAPSPAQARTPLFGSETERGTRRQTIGVRAARASLDSIRDEREGDSSGSQSRTVTLPSQRRERRRTVTEVFA
ncbi:hypothetical protein AZE42_07884 [Rhizopogon vesiculosus]|uniref:Uncharacterized protein n=1 Tax=Rhizopogon vesiculosus TaxID=180088 RepID=A0A1J8QC55_9AGAM|nr:hypothetical protein AZE42_07884 [Rhizopogon vesiculosus]